VSLAFCVVSVAEGQLFQRAVSTDPLYESNVDLAFDGFVGAGNGVFDEAGD
jgi:hypothetical protein